MTIIDLLVTFRRGLIFVVGYLDLKSRWVTLGFEIQATPYGFEILSKVMSILNHFLFLERKKLSYVTLVWNIKRKGNINALVYSLWVFLEKGDFIILLKVIKNHIFKIKVVKRHFKRDLK